MIGGDRRIKMRFVAGHPQCVPLIAEADGAVVGTGVATLNGPVAWIGTIWVDPGWRRRGLGRALTEATMAAGEAAGCRTFVLVATRVGQPLYERLGFELQTWYHIKEAPGLAADTATQDERPVTAPVRPFRAADLPAMAALDRAATGEDRRHLLEAFVAPDTALCLDRPDGSLGGFVIRAPWGGGATIAPDLADAMAVLRARRLAAGPDKRVRVGLLAENEAGRERLRSEGWSDVWQGPRMILGPMPDWSPSAIWGQFDHAVG
ncbi:MAG: GNAT family N-acetyltransferase [Chloroflexi bacterium]|nr:GNAT family N-acetyltransferase [Chloroflexota bacterium]